MQTTKPKNNLFKNLWDYRNLLYFLVLRDIKVRYKQAFFGVAWAILTPAAQALILTFVFSFFIRSVEVNVPYILIVYSGMVFWNFLSQSVASATNSLIDNYNLVTKTPCPKEIFIISSILGRLPDFLISLVLLFLMMLLYKISISLTILYILPLIILQLILIVGLGFILAATNVFYRDIYALIPLILSLWFYLSPVIYPMAAIPRRYHFIISLNPMTGIIDNFRNVGLLHSMPDFLSLSISSVISIFLFVIGFIIFKKLERKIPDVI